MTRLDWVVIRRLAARLGITLLVFFGLLSLVESLDASRFNTLSRLGGPLLALKAIVSGATRTIVGTLPVTVLIGSVIGVLDLQSRREMTIIKASGTSLWRLMRAPLVLVVLLGIFAATVADTTAIEVNRSLPVYGVRSSSGPLWLEQDGDQGHYILYAEHPEASGTKLNDVVLFFPGVDTRDRITADTARLTSGGWILGNAIRYRPDVSPEPLPNYRVSTATTAGDMRIRLTSPRDLTFGELLGVVSQNVADPALRGAAYTSLFRLFALPFLLVGSVLIAFAFTSGYRRTNKYGGAVLGGVVLGFVVYVVTELSQRSGFAGVLDPSFAAGGPAFVAIVIGVSVLLYKEDGKV